MKFDLSWLTGARSGPAIVKNRLDPFALETPLCFFSDHARDVFTIRHAAEGIQVLGSSGSGKSTGSGKHLALALLESGAGGLILCVKGDEPKVWEEYCALTGRRSDLVVFGPAEPWRFNFMEHHFRTGVPGSITEDLVSLFSSLAEVAERGAQNGADYWSRAMNQLTRNAISLAIISEGVPNLQSIYSIISTAPQSPDEARSDGWQRSSRCFQCIARGERRPKTPTQAHDWPLIVRFWLSEFPNLSSRTRSCIISTFTTIADTFLRGELHRLFGTTTNVTPGSTFQGKIVLVATPIKRFGEFGRLAAVLWKHVWQKAAEARDLARNPRHVFLWADEAQHFISKADSLFLTTSRSAKVVTVLLTQNLPNYLAVMSKAETDSLLGNLATKIWHRNSCHVTNTHASDTLAKSRQFRWSTNVSLGDDPLVQPRQLQNIGGSDAVDWEILPGDFQYLRSGGPQHQFQVEGIIHQAGRIWAASGKNFIRVTFNQQSNV